MDDYNKVKGPYLYALLDQLLEQTQIVAATEQIDAHDDDNTPTMQRKLLLLCTTRAALLLSAGEQQNDDDLVVGNKKIGDTTTSLLDELASSFEFHDSHLLIMDDYNPITLHEKLSSSSSNSVDPAIIWVRGHNAFLTRHYLRTSGLDRWIQQRCCGPATTIATKDSCVPLYVGEGAGAIIAGATMDVAYVMKKTGQGQQHDPSASPELQIHGLGLLGIDHRSVAFGIDSTILQKHHRTKQMMDSNLIEVCDDDQVFVWSQSQDDDGDNEAGAIASATRFVMTPSRRGMIERLSHPDPLPVLLIDEQQQYGVQCTGEPAIDPSRSMQRIGDSEWMNEFLDLQ
jgi:hypothetical protein